MRGRGQGSVHDDDGPIVTHVDTTCCAIPFQVRGRPKMASEIAEAKKRSSAMGESIGLGSVTVLTECYTTARTTHMQCYAKIQTNLTIMTPIPPRDLMACQAIGTYK